VAYGSPATGPVGMNTRRLLAVTGFHLLTWPVPKPRLAAGGIRTLMVPLGQLGHGAGAASSGGTQVGGHSRR
jgi:hypothetical protein